MKKKFITEDFLLQNQRAAELYNNYAAELPIIDYHNHLSPKEIWEDKQYENLTQLWIAGDHYKWRAMRTAGIDEKYITGNASDKEKFLAWAKTVPQTLRNPLFHWTHLELKRYFGIEELLNEASAGRIYDQVNEQLKDRKNSCRGLLRKMKVESLCTTEDPTDTLEYHRKLRDSSFEVRVSTAFRPDNAFMIGSGNYRDYLGRLEEAAAMAITSVEQLCEALLKRIQYFHDHGCRLCDHGLEYLPYEPTSAAIAEAVFQKGLGGNGLSQKEIDAFRTYILLFLGRQYRRLHWVQQFHLGPLRNTNSRKSTELGPDTGWDSIGDFPQAKTMSQFLDLLDKEDSLPKTILYNINPADNAVFASMIGNFNDGSVRGKVQYGSGWWYLDQKQGILDQLNALSNMGLLSCFVGMLTDSRSFLSYPRHEYFRRVLCNLLGEEMENGELPDDMEMIGTLVTDICYRNAKDYFTL